MCYRNVINEKLIDKLFLRWGMLWHRRWRYFRRQILYSHSNCPGQTNHRDRRIQKDIRVPIAWKDDFLFHVAHAKMLPNIKVWSRYWRGVGAMQEIFKIHRKMLFCSAY